MKQEWKRIDEGLWQCPYEFSAGVCRSILVQLDEKKFLVYSPGDQATADLAKSVIPEDSEIFLLAPNTFHNLGLVAWSESFPKAKPVAAAPAIARLQKKTGLQLENIEGLKGELPEHITLLELPHNKIGEVWLDIRGGSDRVWVVCDAIFNFSSLPGGVMGFFMKLNRMGPGIEMSRMYQYMGTSNKKKYGQWLMSEISEKKPTQFIPLHGEIYEKQDLTEKLQVLARRRLVK